MKWNYYSIVQPEAVKTVVCRAKFDGELNPYTYRIYTGLDMAICGLNSQWECCDMQWLYLEDVEAAVEAYNKPKTLDELFKNDDPEPIVKL